MKITVFLLLVSVAGVFASKSYSQTKMLNLNMREATVKEVLKSIEQQSEFYFLYSEDLIDAGRKINVYLNNKKIEEALNQIFEGTDVNYSVRDRIIVLTTPEVLKGELPVLQQQKSVSGKVTDNSGSPLPGVSIVVKGTTTGTITDADGNYSLANVRENATLQFSFVGMKAQEVAVAGKTTVNVKMEEDAIGIDEVVAVGYGTMRKIDMTGSAGSVKGQEISKAPVKSFDEALAGRVAGVQVTSNDGQPGSGMNIVIRGANSLTQNNSPLYVVDGFPLEENDNNSLNTADIETIDVLKDASATAIYGARGANGVIMITTKRGKAGIPVINFDSYFGFQEVIKKMELLSPYEFVRWQLERNPEGAAGLYLTDGKTLDSYKNEPGIDWQDKIFRVAPIQNYNLSVRGGTNQSKYSISGSIMDQDGIVINSGFRRYQGRVTLDQEISKKLKIGINVNYADSKSYGTKIAEGATYSDNFLFSVWGYRTLNLSLTDYDVEEVIFDELVNTGIDRRVNPLIQLRNEMRENITSNLFSNGYLEYNILKGLDLKITGGISKNLIKSNNFNNSKTRSGSPENPQSIGVNGSSNTLEINNLSNENLLTYHVDIDKNHKLDILGVYSQQVSNSNYFGGSAIQVPNEILGISGLDEGTPTSITSSQSEWKLKSYLWRVNYNFKSKYLLTASFRADGSSKFAKQNRWGYFPSTAIAYRISEEKFIKNIKSITNAKLRLSYGVTGNNRVSDFASLSTIGFPYSLYYPFASVNPSIGGGVTQVGNPDLKWESTQQINAGLDVALFKNRISLTGDFYVKNTKDLLLSTQLPKLTGYRQVFKNIGKVKNSGFELAINSVNISKSKFEWITNFNIAFNKNKILELGDNEESLVSFTSGVFNTSPKYIAKVGHPLAQFYGVIYDGLYQLSDFEIKANGSYKLKPEIPDNGTDRNTIQPGAIKLRDINFDGTINFLDYTVIGDPNPDFIGGLTNSFKYKGFDCGIFLQFSYGNQVLNANRITFEGEQGTLVQANTNMFADFADRWSLQNQSGKFPVYGSSIEKLTSRVIEDGSFLRLKTLSLGYTLPASILQVVNVKSLRVYSSAQNLFTWTSYSGIDPDVSVRNSALTPAYDYSAYPRAKTITIGINATF